MAGGMASVSGDEASPARTDRSSRISALPSVQARVLAFLAIVLAGVCGALIGSSLTKVGCTANCGTSQGVGGVVGAVIAAVGVAVIAVLVLRAMGEWRTIKEERALQAEPAPAGEGADEAPDPGVG